MSKRVKSLLRKEIVKRLGGVKELAVVGVVGVDAVATNRLRGQLREKGIRITVVKNAMARQAFTDIGLEGAVPLIEGPCALAYGGEGLVNVVRELLARTKDVPKLAVKGAFMEGEIFPAERIEELSKYPTRIEALGNISGLVLSPGARLVGAVLGVGSVLAGILKTIEEKAEKASEAIAPPAEPEAAPA